MNRPASFEVVSVARAILENTTSTKATPFPLVMAVQKASSGSPKKGINKILIPKGSMYCIGIPAFTIKIYQNQEKMLVYIYIYTATWILWTTSHIYINIYRIPNPQVVIRNYRGKIFRIPSSKFWVLLSPKKNPRFRSAWISHRGNLTTIFVFPAKKNTTHNIYIYIGGIYELVPGEYSPNIYLQPFKTFEHQHPRCFFLRGFSISKRLVLQLNTFQFSFLGCVLQGIFHLGEGCGRSCWGIFLCWPTHQFQGR